MARGNDSGVIVMSIIGLIVVILLIIGEAFRGNFTPLLVVMGIILLIYIFIKVTELRQHKTAKDKINVEVNPESNFNFPRFILILLLLGFFIGGFFFNKSSSSNVETVPIEEPMPTPETLDSAAAIAEVPKEVIWIKKDFVNTSFQIPDNLVFIDSLSSDNSKLYIDYTSNISMSIVSDLLKDEMSETTIDDFADNISILANNINEENKRNFDDFKLLNYEMSNLGNTKAIKIEESSKKVSGPKNIDMRIISYHIISKPHYYKVTFSYPQEKPEFLETFERINKTFDFNNSLDKENDSTINNHY